MYLYKNRCTRVATLEEALRYGRTGLRNRRLFPPMLGASVPPLSNSLESGQADTTLITPANSGGAAGNAFDLVQGGFTSYSTTHSLSGTLSAKCDFAAANQQTYVRWTSLGTITTDVYWRVYVWLPNLPNNNQAGKVVVAQTAATATSGQFSINSSGHVAVANASAALITTGVGTAVVAGQWVRLEGHIISATTNGTIEMRSWNAPSSTGAPDDTCSSTTAVLGTDTDRFNIGFATISNAANYVFWMDDLAVSTAGWIGPTPTVASNQTVILACYH